MSRPVSIPLAPQPVLPPATREKLHGVLARNNNKAVFEFRDVLCQQIIETKYDIKMQERMLQLLRDSKGQITQQEASAQIAREAVTGQNNMAVPQELTHYGGHVVKETLRGAVKFDQGG